MDELQSRTIMMPRKMLKCRRLTPDLDDSADFFTKLGLRVEDKLQAAILNW